MARLTKTFLAVLILAGLLLAARPVQAFWYPWCPDVANAAAQVGGQFWVTSSQGYDAYFNVSLWGYEVSVYGETFYGTCAE